MIGRIKGSSCNRGQPPYFRSRHIGEASHTCSSSRWISIVSTHLSVSGHVSRHHLSHLNRQLDAPTMQAPQWTDFLQCPICLQDFNDVLRLPVSLACGHTVCKSCLSNLQRRQCQFCSSPITTDIEKLPVNDALLLLTSGGSTLQPSPLPYDVLDDEKRDYLDAKRAIESLALLLKPLSILGTVGSTNNGTLSRPMQRKLVTLINCQLIEAEGRARAMRAARSLGERTVTELLLHHQNQQQLSSNLWAAVRQRGCQFLGPALQEECLRLILFSLEGGVQLSRKVLVKFVVSRLQEKEYHQASKTSVGHVVQLLYRASCFKVGVYVYVCLCVYVT